MNASNPTKKATAIRFASYFVRFALAAAFLSAVADRFGFRGAPGTEGVAWGNLDYYESYVGLLNWFAPTAIIPALGWVATIAEVGIAIGLFVGWQLRWFALAAGLLLTTFAVTMVMTLGVKPPLNFSVLSAASGAYLLFAVTETSTKLQSDRDEN